MRHEELFERLAGYCKGISEIDPRTSSTMFRRNVSAEWIRGRFTDVDPSGFNPFSGRVFYSRYSCLDELADQSDAPLSPDLFSYEVFYALHDFVHVWSLHELARLSQDICGSWKSCRDIEPRWFKLLLLCSEAAATVTVDYWMLCTRPLSSHVGDATLFKSLTTPFQAAHDNPRIHGNRRGVNIESPEFLVQLALAYCAGWVGPLRDLMNDFGEDPPAWLLREHQQALRQTRLADQWLVALKGESFSATESRIDGEQFELFVPNLLHIAYTLQQWLDSGCLERPQIHTPIADWCDTMPDHRDFRFLNAASWLKVANSEDRHANRSSNCSYLSAQILSRIRPCQFVGLKQEFRGRTLSDIPSATLAAAIEEIPPLTGGANGPLNLFFIS